MVGYGVKIMQSEHAVRRWTERRVRFQNFEWRGKRDWKSYTIEVECSEPCAYRMGETIVMHPALYRRLMEHEDVKQAPPKETRPWTERMGLIPFRSNPYGVLLANYVA